jgi:hypothetical protein
MLTRRIASWQVGVTAVLLWASTAVAQHYQPFIEPGYFDHDLQFFAPAADIDTYGGDPVLRYGWFGSYNRMYIGVSRPDLYPNNPLVNPSQTPIIVIGSTTDIGVVDIGQTYPESSDLLDMTWGNRWDLGYMVDDVDHDHGWLFAYTHVDGPNWGNSVRQQRLNRVNEDDEGLPPPTTTGGGGGGGQNQITVDDFVDPPSDRNNAGSFANGGVGRERFYDITDTLNKAKLASVELNKIFRMDPLNHGGILEPFFGVRYIKFEDWFTRQWYQVYDDDGLSPTWPPGGPSSIPILFEDTTTEDRSVFNSLFTNQMIGGQLGLRWLKRVSRWNLSSEFRAFGMQNFQHQKRGYEVERTIYDGQGTGSEVNAILNFRATEDRHTTETVVGSDIRALAAFEVTRDIKLEAGVQFLGFFTGIGRGPDMRERNSEAVTMVGLTFGFEVCH